ncbi:MAG: hypothetical protein R6U40_06850 [Desulfobacterales bacterium]
MKKVAIFVLIFPFLLATLDSSAQSSRYQKRGFIQNANGDQCWYTQVVKKDNTYFHENIKGDNGIITFDDPICMSDGGSSFNMEVNKMMINNVVARWYSHSDANFKTRVPQMFRTSDLQINGYCIQSEKYPLIGITIDYFLEGNSITGVIHGSSIMGCKN